MSGVSSAECPLIIVTGVAGSGKSTVGRALALSCGATFIEGDSLHPRANIERMVAGQPLDDGARMLWLENIVAAMDAVPRESIGVVTCSALKRSYREHLRAGRPRALFLCLAVEKEVAHERMTRRVGHFMPPDLIDSQFADLEPPAPDENALVLDATLSVEEIVARACRAFRLPCSKEG